MQALARAFNPGTSALGKLVALSPAVALCAFVVVKLCALVSELGL